MTSTTTNTETLPEMRYVRHITTVETVMIQRGEMGYLPVDIKCSPECLNGQLARVPTEDEIAAMRDGSLMGLGRIGHRSSVLATTTRARNITADREHTFLLGLPTLRGGALWQTARRLEAPVLISANVLSRWRTDIIGLRLWSGFETLPAIEKRASGMEEWEW